MGREPAYYTVPRPSGTREITTPRLDLRRFKSRDAENLHKWSKDDAIMEFFQGQPFENIAEAANAIASWRVQYANDEYMLWCIQDAETKSAVGKISANIDIAGASAEVEYSIASWARRKGYGAEALAGVVSYLHEAGFHRVVAKINTRNSASISTAEKCGFELEGICRDALVDRDGAFYDVALYAHIARTGSSADLESVSNV